MHQGLPARFLLIVAMLFPAFTLAQLNTADEIIETIGDIPIEDDSSEQQNEETPNKPKFDEEFSTGKLPVQEIIEPDIEEQTTQRPITPTETDEDFVEEGFGTADGPEKEAPSYEDELQKNAEENQLERKEISPEDLKSFEVEPVIEQAKPEPQSPEEINPADELKEEITNISPAEPS